jgi:hypothetical protein
LSTHTENRKQTSQQNVLPKIHPFETTEFGGRRYEGSQLGTSRGPNLGPRRTWLVVLKLKLPLFFLRWLLYQPYLLLIFHTTPPVTCHTLSTTTHQNWLSCAELVRTNQLMLHNSMSSEYCYHLSPRSIIFWVFWRGWGTTLQGAQLSDICPKSNAVFQSLNSKIVDGSSGTNVTWHPARETHRGCLSAWSSWYLSLSVKYSLWHDPGVQGSLGRLVVCTSTKHEQNTSGWGTHNTGSCFVLCN